MGHCPPSPTDCSREGGRLLQFAVSVPLCSAVWTCQPAAAYGGNGVAIAEGAGSRIASQHALYLFYAARYKTTAGVGGGGGGMQA